MSNREFYKSANNQIKAEERLKRITRNQWLENEKPHNRIALKLANVAAILLLIFSVAWLSMSQNKQSNQVQSLLHPEMTTQDVALPKIENGEMLVSMLENLNKERLDTSIYYEATNESAMRDELEYSKTNEQVEGVAEADIVKTDGQYVYYIAGQDVYIMEADTLQVVYKVDYNTENFIPSEMFLEENYLVVIGQKIIKRSEDIVYYDIAYAGNACVIVYDVSQKDDIKEIRKIDIEGYLVTSRMIEDMVYLVANQPVALTEETKEDTDKLKPTYLDTAISEEKQKVEFSDIYYFPGEIEESSYLILASFSVKESTRAEVQTYLGAGNEVYVSEKNIYVTKLEYQYDFNLQAKSIMSFSPYANYTEIYRFALKEGKIIYEASGKVSGHVLNQFSMDETEGYFRIATTQTDGEGEQTKNALYVLNQDLNIVGRLENLAKGERIYAVRYLGGKGYVVTFKQTDPLYVIDLENPYLPVVLGELKVPGYSTYLHPYGETYLIGIGQDTANQGENVVNTGIKVSLFDIHNETAPEERSSITIGERGSYSEALYNHKAFLCSKEKNLLTFPITVMEKVNGETKITFQGAIVYGISEEGNIYERGRVTANKENEIIQRCFYIENKLYVCSNKGITAVDLNTMQETNQVTF